MLYNISVIVPLYYGKKYISQILEMCKKNTEGTTDIVLEVIFVNDSPTELVSIEKYQQEYPMLKIQLLVNEKNEGIHFSRVKALEYASGTFVMFFDQDDKIEDNYFKSQCKKIKKADVVVANGVAQYRDYSKLLYRFWFMQWTVKHGWFYAKFDGRIISPGQCLIRKESIPEEWTKYILKKNGSDDGFLWLMMLTQKKKFVINRECIYSHIYTGENTSDNKKGMDDSKLEYLAINKEKHLINSHYATMIENRLLRNKKKGVLTKIIERINRM